jgi:hypothetical protein
MIIAYHVLYLTLGVLMGILLRRFLFSIKSSKTFSKSILPTIHSLKDYSHALRECLENTTVNSADLQASRKQLEKSLVTKKGMYPEWIYHSGYNPGLRSSHRFYLIQLERAIELLFSIEFMIGEGQLLLGLPSDELAAMIAVMRGNEDLIAHLTVYFGGESFDSGAVFSSNDFMTDIKNLDIILQQRAPGTIEVLDIAPDYVNAILLGRNVKDLRQSLFNLISSLPS